MATENISVWELSDRGSSTLFANLCLRNNLDLLTYLIIAWWYWWQGDSNDSVFIYLRWPHFCGYRACCTRIQFGSWLRRRWTFTCRCRSRWRRRPCWPCVVSLSCSRRSSTRFIDARWCLPSHWITSCRMWHTRLCRRSKLSRSICCRLTLFVLPTAFCSSQSITSYYLRGGQPKPSNAEAVVSFGQVRNTSCHRISVIAIEFPQCWINP